MPNIERSPRVSVVVHATSPREATRLVRIVANLVGPRLAKVYVQLETQKLKPRFRRGPLLKAEADRALERDQFELRRIERRLTPIVGRATVRVSFSSGKVPSCDLRVVERGKGDQLRSRSSSPPLLIA